MLCTPCYRYLDITMFSTGVQIQYSVVCFVLCVIVNTNLLHGTEYNAHTVDNGAAFSIINFMCNGLECTYMLERYTTLQTGVWGVERNAQYLVWGKLTAKAGYDAIMEMFEWLFMTHNIGVEIPYDNG